MDLSSFVQQFKQRKSHTFIQFIKYSICGGFATLIHIVTFYIFAGLIFPALTADDIVVKYLNIPTSAVTDAIRARNAVIDNAAAFILSNLVAYILNILWVFESGRHHKAVEIGMFYLVSGISLMIGSLLMGILIKYLSFTTTISFVAVMISSAAVNFAARKYLIFKG
jgi:putative flippase GtrA